MFNSIRAAALGAAVTCLLDRVIDVEQLTYPALVVAVICVASYYGHFVPFLQKNKWW